MVNCKQFPGYYTRFRIICLVPIRPSMTGFSPQGLPVNAICLDANTRADRGSGPRLHARKPVRR